MLDRDQIETVLLKVAPSLPRQIRTQLAEATQSEAARAGYDPLFVLAVVGVESRFRLAVSSERGARGLVQLMPSTFAWISAREPDIGGQDLETGDDPVVDVRLAIRYFRWLERRFHSREGALIAYNAGPRRYQQYAISGKRVPDRLKEYPRRVMKEYRRLIRIADGQEDPRRLLARAP